MTLHTSHTSNAQQAVLVVGVLVLLVVAIAVAAAVAVLSAVGLFRPTARRLYQSNSNANSMFADSLWFLSFFIPFDH